MFEFRLDATQGLARAGTLTLPHGTVTTPAFMPVGTHGVVRGLSAADVARTGAQIILGNTYHLHLRPGEGVVQAMGGLHRFTTWPRPMLTDSSENTWNPPESVSMGRGQVVKRCSPPMACTTPSPGRRWRW